MPSQLTFDSRYEYSSLDDGISISEWVTFEHHSLIFRDPTNQQPIHSCADGQG